MYEVAAIGETGEGGKCRPGEKIVHRTSIALTAQRDQMLDSIATLVHANMTQAREKPQASLLKRVTFVM